MKPALVLLAVGTLATLLQTVAASFVAPRYLPDLGFLLVLGVAAATLESQGAVSEAVVREMALGALARSCAGVAVAVSGIAGPGGGSAEKPLGTVCFAWALSGREPVTRRECFGGDREAVRRQTVQRALEGLIGLLEHD